MKSSKIVEDRTQIDGRRNITEKHVTDADRTILVSYLAEASVNASSAMTARVPQIEAQLLSEELMRQRNNLINGVIQKEKIYFKSFTDAIIKLNLSLTNEELLIFRELKE